MIFNMTPSKYILAQAVNATVGRRSLVHVINNNKQGQNDNINKKTTTEKQHHWQQYKEQEQ